MIRIFRILLLLVVFPTFVFSQNEKYPIPKKTNTLLFYIQRNLNANTIIYEAKFDKKGNLDKNEPIIVYWRRYDEQGQKMELRLTDKWYAYGLDWSKTDSDSIYKIELVADKERKFWLKQIAPFKAVLTTKINAKLSVLDHIYIFADNSGLWPTVKYIELFGHDVVSEQENYEKLIVD